MILQARKFWQRCAIIALTLTFPALSGLDQVALRAQDLADGGAWENTPLEREGGAWAESVADSLDDDPARIVEWMRREVRFQAYGGSRKGALGAYRSRRANTVDSAALLAALLDAAELPYRFASGDVRIGIGHAEEWLGVRGAQGISAYLDAAGIAHRLEGGTTFVAEDDSTAGRTASPTGTPQWVVLEDHLWIQLRSDYLPALGSADDDRGGDVERGNDPAETWVDIDTSIARRERPLALNLAAVAGFDAETIRRQADEFVMSDNTPDETLHTTLPFDLIAARAKQAGERLDRSLSAAGIPGTRIGDLTGALLVEERDALPAMMPAEVVGSVTYHTSLEAEEIANEVFRNRRERVTVTVKAGAQTWLWEPIPAALAASGPFTVQFAPMPDTDDPPAPYADSQTVPLRADGQALARLQPVLRVGGHAIAPAASASGMDYGVAVQLEVLTEGRDGEGNSVDRIRAVAGGVYAIAPYAALDEDAATSLSLSLRAPDAVPSERAREVAALAAVTGALHMERFAAAGLAAGGRAHATAAPRGVVAGLEPAITGGSANPSAEGVRLVAWPFGDPGATAATGTTALGEDSAEQLRALIEDVALTGPMEGIAGHAGYFSPGRLLTIVPEQGDDLALPVYRQGAPGTALTPGRVPAIAGAEDAIRAAFPGGVTTLSDEGFWATGLPEDPSVLPGFGWWKRHGGVAQGSAYAAEDGAAMQAWSPALYDLSLSPARYLCPLDLVPREASASQGAVSRAEILGVRAAMWSDSLLRTTSAMEPGIAGAALLAGPWLDRTGTSLGWAPAMPAVATALHENARAFRAPRVTGFEVEPLLLNTKNVADPGDPTRPQNAPKSLRTTLELSRVVDAATVQVRNTENEVRLSRELPDVATMVTVFCAYETDGTDPDCSVGLLDTQLENSGLYHVEAFGTLQGGLSSTVAETVIEVDNDAPAGAISGVNSPSDGFIEITGTVEDKNLREWYIERRKVGEAWSRVPGFSGNTSVRAPRALAAFDTRAAGWTAGEYEVRVVGVDAVGNVGSSAPEDFLVTNDLDAPQIAVSGIAAGQTITGPTAFTITATENLPTDKGLALFDVKLVEDVIIPALIPLNRTLERTTFRAAPIKKEHTGEFTISTDDLPLPLTGDREFAIEVTARDHAGNESRVVLPDIRNGNIFQAVDADSEVWPVGDGYGTPKPNSANVDVTFRSGVQPVPFTLTIRRAGGRAYVNGATLDPGTVVATLTPDAQGNYVWFGNLPAFNSGWSAPDGLYHAVAEATVGGVTYSARDDIRVFGPLDRPVGGFPLLARLDTITTGTPGLIDNSVSLNSGTVENAQSLVAVKGRHRSVDIWATVGGQFAAYLDGGSLPEPLFPADGYPPQQGTTYWALQFKPSNVEPTLETINSTPPGLRSFVNISSYSKWTTIAAGSNVPDDKDGDPQGLGTNENWDSKPLYFGTWDITSVPTGYYDVRLWSYGGDGATRHNVIGPIKIANETDTDGGSGGGDVGALTLSAVDMRVPFAGFTAELRRDYSSREALADGPFGYGWKLRGIGLEVDSPPRTDEADEAQITLPDGRQFFFANVPHANVAGQFVVNKWLSTQEYLIRPYGMKLYRPGGILPGNEALEGNVTPSPVAMAPGSTETLPLATGSYKHFNYEYGKGEVAFLQTEDRTWYVFEWKTGDLIKIIHPSGQVTNFIKETATSNGGTVALDQSEILVREAAAGAVREMRLVRDPNPPHRILMAEDPLGNKVHYQYDAHGNLTAVTDRRGFTRFYVYDTPEAKAAFAGERDDLTGLRTHFLVDTRLDNDEDMVANFEGDVLPEALPEGGIARATALLASQNWPGDFSILRHRYDDDGNVTHYETGAGSVELAYDKDPDGSGSVDVKQSESGAMSRVDFSEEGRVEKVTDVYGGTTTYTYEEVEDVRGLLTEEVNAAGEVTRYDYDPPAINEPGSFADIFQSYMDSRVSGLCSGGVGTACLESYIPQDYPGYLTSAQLQPSELSQEGRPLTAADLTAGLLPQPPIKTSIAYNGEGGNAPFQPNSINDPMGRETVLGYAPNGQMSKVVPPQGTGDPTKVAVTFYYGSIATPNADGVPHDANDTDPIYGTTHDKDSYFAGKIQATVAGNRRTDYGYRLNPSATLEGGWLEEHATKQQLDDTGFSYSFSRLDKAGRVIESWTSDINPGNNGIFAEPLSAQDNYTKTEYDGEGNVLRSGSDDRGYSETVMDWQGRVVESVSLPAADSTDGRSSTTRYAYDEFGRQLAVETKDQDGTVLSRTEMRYETIPANPAPDEAVIGRREISIDRRGYQTVTEYDKGGRQVATRRLDPEGRPTDETTTEYDIAGRQIAVRTLDGGLSRTEYDQFGRTRASIARADDVLNTVTMEYAYDEVGRQVASSNGIGGWTVTEYLDTDPNNPGAVARVHTNQPSPTATVESVIDYLYDERGRRTDEIDEEERRTHTMYDDYGRVVGMILNAVELGGVGTGMIPSASPTAPDNAIFRFRFDDEGRQTHILKPAAYAQHEAAEPTLDIRKVYDDEGRLVREFGPVNNDDTGPGLNRRMVKVFEYDAEGRLQHEMHGTSGPAASADAAIDVKQWIAYEYDPKWGGISYKRLYKGAFSDPAPQSALEREEHYAYYPLDGVTDDPNGGQLASVTTTDHTVSPAAVRVDAWEYDPDTGAVAAKISPEGRIDYKRDAQGRLTEIATSTGLRTIYGYDRYGRMTSVREAKLAVPGALAGGADELGETRYEYDNLGRKTRVVYPNGAKAIYSYDDAPDADDNLISGWLKDIRHEDRNGGLLLNLAYHRDRTGLIRRIAETRPNATDNNTWFYGYDQLKRLTDAHNRAGLNDAGGATVRRYQYTYDRNGNRQSQTVQIGAGAPVSTTYTYNALDQMRTESPSMSAAKSFAWDEMGRMASEGPTNLSSARTRTFAWSVDDRLLGVTLNEGSTPVSIRYGYDPDGTLISREQEQAGTPGDSRGLLVDYENPTGYSQALAEVSPDGVTPLRNNVFDPSGVLAQTSPTDPAFHHNDHLGTIRQLTGPTGSGLNDAALTYEPFGSPTSGNSSLTSYAFTGQWRDSATGDQYQRVRWYDAFRARWSTADPLFDLSGAFGNGYLYTRSSPVSSYDPSGMQSLGEMVLTATINTLLVTIAGGALFSAMQASVGGESAGNVAAAALFGAGMAVIGLLVFIAAIVAIAAMSQIPIVGPQLAAQAIHSLYELAVEGMTEYFLLILEAHRKGRWDAVVFLSLFLVLGLADSVRNVFGKGNILKAQANSARDIVRGVAEAAPDGTAGPSSLPRVVAETLQKHYWDAVSLCKPNKKSAFSLGWREIDNVPTDDRLIAGIAGASKDRFPQGQMPPAAAAKYRVANNVDYPENPLVDQVYNERHAEINVLNEVARDIREAGVSPLDARGDVVVLIDFEFCPYCPSSIARFKMQYPGLNVYVKNLGMKPPRVTPQ